MDDKKVNIDPIVEKVLTLQIHKVPILSLCGILGLPAGEVDKIMREHGYVQIDGIYKIPAPVEPKKVEKKKKVVRRKRKSKQQLLEEEIAANPTRALARKYGVYNFDTHLFHIDVELVKVLKMQDDEKLPLEEIAKRMNMTVKVLTNFMKKKNYILQEEEQTNTRKTKKKKEPRMIFVKTKPVAKEVKKEVEEDEEEELVEIPLVRVDETNEVAECEIGFTEEEAISIKKMYNWYLSVKDLPVFKKKVNKEKEF